MIFLSKQINKNKYNLAKKIFKKYYEISKNGQKNRRNGYSFL